MRSASARARSARKMRSRVAARVGRPAMIRCTVLGSALAATATARRMWAGSFRDGFGVGSMMEMAFSWAGTPSRLMEQIESLLSFRRDNECLPEGFAIFRFPADAGASRCANSTCRTA